MRMQPLARAVGRHLLDDDLGAREVVPRGELLEQGLGDVAHRREFARAAVVDPVPELRHAHLQLALGHADLGERAGELGTGRPCEAHGRAILGGGDG